MEQPIALFSIVVLIGLLTMTLDLFFDIFKKDKEEKYD